jgi:hypothetical protein
MEAGSCCTYFLERQKGNRALVGNYRPISILNNFSKIFESIIHDHLSFYFKFKLHPNQHGFVKSKSAVTNLVTCLNDVSPLRGRTGDIHEHWKSLKRAVYETAMEVLGTQRRRNPRRLKIWNEDLKEAIEGKKKRTFTGSGVAPKII